jgi:hypothetical protein
MTEIYTTEELIQILDRELKANWRGDRVLLSSAERLGDPVVAKAIDLDKVGKVFAYREFQQQIHAYQQKNQVSGIIWRNSSFQGQTIRFPEVHNQLIAIASDKLILMTAKESILNFWRKATKDMNFWLFKGTYQAISREYAEKLAQQTEWAEFDAALTEVYLGLCWGEPKECQYQWAKPQSGCYRVIATTTEPGQIKF